MRARAGFRGARALHVCIALIVGVSLMAGCGSREPAGTDAEEGAKYFYRLAAEKQHEGDFESAITLYEKALQVDPDFSEAYLDIGIIYDDCLVDKEKAIAHYREFLRLEPQSEKADMVRRWVQRAEREKGACGGGGSGGAGGLAGAAAEMQRELKQSRAEVKNLKVEKEAYLKTVAALREDLLEARKELQHFLNAGSRKSARENKNPASEKQLASLARSLRKEKSEILERYRSEKGGLERTLEALKKQLEDLKARKEASEDALKRARDELRELRRERARPKPARAENESARKALAASRERLALLERKCRLYIKDNRALAQKLKETEKALGEARAKMISMRAAAPAGVAQVATPSPHLVAKFKADAEKKEQEIRQAYEKQLVELRGALKRERAEAEKRAAGAEREAARLRGQAEKYRQASARAERERKRALEKLSARFMREKSEMERSFRREREILLSRLGEAKRRRSLAPAPQVSRQPSGDRPSPGARPASADAKAGAAAARRYRVTKGDTLASIAARYYGSPAEWRRIYEANRKTIARPGALRVGQVLLIPE